MNRSEQINELATALAKAQATMKAADMDATNPFLKNRYADLGNIITAIRPAIAPYGLSFVQSPSFDGTTVTVETLVMHDSGQWLSSAIELSIEGEKGLSVAQVMGKAITYLRRYGLASMFGVYADKDEDGNDTGAPSTEYRPAEKKTQADGNGRQPPSHADQKCPKCGGAMWDNRATKTNPKAPDYKCKNKDCGQGVWVDAEPHQNPQTSVYQEMLEDNAWDNLQGGGPQPKQKPAPHDDGVKPARIRTPKFNPAFMALLAKLDGADVPHTYRKADGGVDWYHVTGSVAKCGFEEITEANMGEVIAALESRIMEKATADMHGQTEKG